MPTTKLETDLYTSGYEGLSHEEFIDKLKRNGINTLIDIREKAISRKKGFSKNRLRESLKEKGIDYLHFPELGSPSPIRKELREHGDFDLFFAEYENHLNEQISCLSSIEEIIKSRIACLLCMESDFNKCHRKIVVDELRKISKLSLKIMHI